MCCVIEAVGGRAACLDHLYDLRYDRCLLNLMLFYNDLPSVVIKADDLKQAVEHLEHHDLVLGPASDGGYWLLGIGASLIRSPQDWPLIGIPWGGPTVLEATLEAARRQQLSCALVPQRNDLDHWSDLRPWQG